MARLGGGHGHQFSIMNRIMFKVHHEANIDAPFMIKKQRNRSNRVCNGKLARVPACPRILFEICTKIIIIYLWIVHKVFQILIFLNELVLQGLCHLSKWSIHKDFIISLWQWHIVLLKKHCMFHVYWGVEHIGYWKYITYIFLLNESCRINKFWNRSTTYCHIFIKISWLHLISSLFLRKFLSPRNFLIFQFWALFVLIWWTFSIDFNILITIVLQLVLTEVELFSVFRI